MWEYSFFFAISVHIVKCKAKEAQQKKVNIDYSKSPKQFEILINREVMRALKII